MSPSVRSTADTVRWDQVVTDLRDGLPVWRAVGLPERIGLLRRLRRRVGEEAATMAAATRAAQSLPESGLWAAEAWAPAYGVAQVARVLERVLRLVEADRDPLPAKAIRTRPDGQVVVDVFPATWEDRLLLAGYHGEVWLAPGVTRHQVLSGASRTYRDSADSAGVTLLLGAGNAINLVLTDLIHLLYARNSVVAVKMNPVLAYQRPVVERIFTEFVDRGAVRFVDETIDAGAYLARHPGIDHIHITGSASSHDALVWGTDDAAEDRRANRTPLIDKTITAELGGVGPVVVVPRDWTEADIRRQADLIVYAKLFNSGHICAAPQILILPDGWPHADRLLAEIRRLLTTVPARDRYYPGSEDKVSAVLDRHPLAEPCHGDRNRLVIEGIDPDEDSILFTTEVFADVLGVARLPAGSIPDYLDAAVTFANDRLTGTLAANLLVDPATAKQHAAVMDQAVADLRYGTIGINEWAVLSYNLGYTTWGAYPGHTPDAIGSGTGVVVNAYQLPQPRKSLITAAFRPRLKAFTSVTHRSVDRLIPKMVRYATTDDRRLLPGIILTALQG